MTRGAFAIVFGIIAMTWPIDTAIALMLLWGLWALADSAGSFVQAFERGTPTSARLLLVAMAGRP